MATEEVNPYAPPQTPAKDEGYERVTFTPGNSWLRGIKFAIPCAFAGFLFVYLFPLLGLVLRTCREFQHPNGFYPPSTIGWQFYFELALCSAYIFAMAAIVSFAPARRLEFIGSVLVVGCVGVASLLLAMFVVSYLEWVERGYDHRVTWKNWLFVVIPAIGSLLFTIAYTAARFRLPPRSGKDHL